MAAIDFLSGTEVRVYPFYYLPIAIAATRLGGKEAYLTAAACTAGWVLSNYLDGLTYNSNWIWVWNTFIQGFAFMLIAKLVSVLHATGIRESGLARVDKLTGLLNARAFHEQTSILLALCQRQDNPVVMAFIDLDEFKSVNDTQGHQRGDSVLQIAAQVMKTALRTSDLVARLGGDEFAVLLPNTTADQASETFERMRTALESSMRTAGCAVTASIGAVACSHPLTDQEELIGAADQVMYSVKQSGKNRVRVTKFEAKMGSSVSS